MEADEAQKLMEEHYKKRDALKQKENEQHFSYELEATLTDAERSANKKLIEIRDKIANDDPYNYTIHNYFVNREFMMKSELYEILNTMPKGAIHHLHTTAANPVEAYLKCTYDERTFYSARDALFKVYPQFKEHPEMIEEGYLQCVQMRKFASSPEAYDKELRNQILLTAEQADNLSSHNIWKHFEKKFGRVGELGKFIPFFKELLKAALESCIKQNVFVVEYRHISGMLFGDDKKYVPFIEELKIIRGIVDELQKDTPYFEFRLILTGLKIVGKQHIQKMLDHIAIGSNSEDKRLAELIAGFDLVNEEDFTPEIAEWAEQILTSKQELNIVSSQGAIDNDGMPVFFHAGETHDRDCQNLQDSILLGTKRIGHGFQLFLFPHLQDLVKEKDICIEVCPLSNMVLGYTKDLRTHPVSVLLSKGIQASISSDDPGLFGYEGVTLDYVYACGAWMLDLRDLKKLSLNGIKYANVSEEKKKYYREELFPKKWSAWIDSINARN